jgi:heptosyltransferase I
MAQSPETPPRSLCILRLSAIGDVTHMLPVIATLQQQWPDTRITWIIGKIEYQLVKSLPGVEFIVFDKRKGFAEWLSLHRQLAGRRFDILLMMQVALRASLLSLLIRARRRIGYDRARSRDLHSLFCNERIDGPERVHVLDTFFQFLERMGIHQRRMDWLLKADAQDAEFAQNLIGDRPCVVINPCSSARKNNWRNWPVEHYAEVIDYLAEKGVRVLITGGPSSQETGFADSLIASCKHQPVNLVGQTSLGQLLALLQRAQCLVAPDTGPAHMGTVASIPIIGLYASSNPLRTGPYNSQQHTIDAYPAALKKYNDKNVDQVPWGFRVRDSEVMRMIPVQAVIDKLHGCLKLKD